MESVARRAPKVNEQVRRENERVPWGEEGMDLVVAKDDRDEETWN